MNSHTIKVHGDEFFPIKNFPLAVVQIDRNEAICGQQNYTFIKHSHDFCELELITAGFGIQNIDGVDYPVKAGDIYLLQGNSTHYYKDCKDISLFDILFDPRHLPLPWSYFRKISGYNMIFLSEPNTRTPAKFHNHLHAPLTQLLKLKQSVMKLKDILERKDNFSEVESIGIFIELILMISRMYNFDSINQDNLLPKINGIISLLEKDYLFDFTVADLAKKACTSPRNFQRQFKKITGTSPINYLLQIRLQYAAQILLQQGTTILDVALQCGFNDSNYFTRKFTEKYGLSPRQYRKVYNSKYC